MTASVLAIALGASLGALLRWCLSFTFNPFFPTIPPPGTLAASLISEFSMGIFIGVTQYFPFVPQGALGTGPRRRLLRRKHEYIAYD